MSQILIGVRDDSGGRIVIPGRGPSPVPPWTDYVLRGLSTEGHEILRKLSFVDEAALITDEKARVDFAEIERALSALESQRLMPVELRDGPEGRL